MIKEKIVRCQEKEEIFVFSIYLQYVEESQDYYLDY